MQSFIPYLPQGAALITAGAAILDHGGSHVGQLLRQGLGELSIGVQERETLITTMMAKTAWALLLTVCG